MKRLSPIELLLQVVMLMIARNFSPIVELEDFSVYLDDLACLLFHLVGADLVGKASYSPIYYVETITDFCGSNFLA